MEIVGSFENHFAGQCAVSCALSLAEYREGYYVGVDKAGQAVVVVQSTTPRAKTVFQESRSLRIECNARVTYLLAGTVETDTVHILTCLSIKPDDVRLFLEVADLLLQESGRTAESVLSVYHAVSEFFSNGDPLSDNELLGLFGELFTIYDFAPEFNLGPSWQSTDRMKFDFSLSENLKVEVKSTLSQKRIHRFRHEQIVSSNDVYVVSYQFQPDDAGLSLYDLIIYCQELCANEPRKLLKFRRIIKKSGRERIKSFRFNQEYARQHRRFYHTVDLPHFEEKVPDGVTSVEYDVDLMRVPALSEESFLNVILCKAS